MFYVVAYYEIILHQGALPLMCLFSSLMVSRIHTVKNVSHLMDMSGKELIHDELIHESWGNPPPRTRFSVSPPWWLWYNNGTPSMEFHLGPSRRFLSSFFLTLDA